MSLHTHASWWMKRFENSMQTAWLLALFAFELLLLPFNSVVAAGICPVIFVSFRWYLVTNVAESNDNSRNRRNICIIIKKPFPRETFDLQVECSGCNCAPGRAPDVPCWCSPVLASLCWWKVIMAYNQHIQDVWMGNMMQSLKNVLSL